MTASSITVRRAESLAGEMAEADFGRLGLLQELGSCRPRVVHAFILTLGYSRLSGPDGTKSDAFRTL